MEKIDRVVKRITLGCLLFSLTFFSSCAPDLTDDAIPYVQFTNIIINVSTHPSLQLDGGYEYIGGGVRGIILYRKNGSTYIAYERNSSFHPNEACATVDVDISGLFIIDTCSNSTFSLSNGNPTSGPAITPLRRYVVQLNAFELTITDDIAN
ncbi:MAG: hypothetical protein ABI663_18490 [Chryseolinea sp.]